MRVIQFSPKEEAAREVQAKEDKLQAAPGVPLLGRLSSQQRHLVPPAGLLTTTRIAHDRLAALEG